MKTKKIKATYRNGVIEPLDRIDLPEGQELEVEFSVLQKTPHELTREAKTELIQRNSRFWNPNPRRFGRKNRPCELDQTFKRNKKNT